MRILVAEDDPHLGPSLKKGLEASHYAVDLVTDGEEALSVGLAIPYDLIILDIMLPRTDGFEVCRQLRDQKRMTPILFLTALSGVDHRVNGLDLGADDYLIKPFAFRELEARVRALLRRDGPSKTSELRFMDLTLDTRSHRKNFTKKFTISVPISSSFHKCPVYSVCANTTHLMQTCLQIYIK